LIGLLINGPDRCLKRNIILEMSKNMNIEITVLYNDIPGDTRLETAHGLACLIEGKGQTILFDTGGDGHLLLDNMRKLGKDPKRVDIVIISHQHWDHSGGLFTMLRSTGPVKAFLPKAFAKDLVSHAARLGANVTTVDGPIEIISGIYSTGQLGDDNLVRERREQSLVLDTATGTAVLTYRLCPPRNCRHHSACKRNPPGRDRCCPRRFPFEGLGPIQGERGHQSPQGLGR
jgi:hypothetical protein